MSDRIDSQEFDEAWSLVFDTLMEHTAVVQRRQCTCGHAYDAINKEMILSHNAAMVVTALAARVGLT